jgi:hypothetical protein
VRLLLRDEWATQCAPIAAKWTLLVSGATVRPLAPGTDTSALHIKHGGRPLPRLCLR